MDVLTSQPSYKPEVGLPDAPVKESIDGVTVRRIAMKPDRGGPGRKVVNLARFPLLVFVRVLFGPRYDVVMCSTAPPVVLGALVSIAARLRGARFVYHCMDLHPEIGALSGEFRNPLVFKLLRWVDVRTCRRAAAVVVLSTDMRDVLIARDAELAESVVVLNNFEIPSFDEEPSQAEAIRPAESERLRIVFTGNVGRFQGLETIVSAVLGGDPVLDDLELVFMGEGAAKADLVHQVEQAPESVRQRVSFRPHGTVRQAQELMGTAQLGLVSLTPGVISFAYPSKTGAYLSQGLPLLVAVEPHSSLAREVREWGVGDVLPTDSVEDTQGSLVSLVKRRDELAAMRPRALEAWRENFATETLLPRWDALLDDVRSERRSA